jgi:hypothetical protein
METILKYIEKNLNRRKVPIEVSVLEEFFSAKNIYRRFSRLIGIWRILQ